MLVSVSSVGGRGDVAANEPLLVARDRERNDRPYESRLVREGADRARATPHLGVVVLDAGRRSREAVRLAVGEHVRGERVARALLQPSACRACAGRSADTSRARGDGLLRRGARPLLP